MNVYYVHEDLQNMGTCIKFEYEKKIACMYVYQYCKNMENSNLFVCKTKLSVYFAWKVY